ncbi:YqeB family protein [Saccharothrix coeruleofusca]|uniref:Uncharacterized protein n=1 Tax=Saccharothrix coeruleofusca TaxID=33919 RepID=A0A918EBC8_9PSEU|nr:hypothetical protein [Saccharothrix coeruleofusca]GGP40999.1 hypothetical protein GCM10010185_10110 [Saccharothrix coeruleofusca]
MEARRTTVAQSKQTTTLVWVGFPVLGAFLLWLVVLVADWVAALPWAPMRGPFQLVASIPEPHATVGALVVGALGGLVLSVLAALERLAVEVADDRVVFTRGNGTTREFDRTRIAGVFLDGRKLVLLGLDGGELTREDAELDADELADAFQSHGYPWLPDGDPHRDEYRRWVEGAPGLPPGADALLRVRAEALRKRDAEDAAQLREELGRLGVVVREDRKRQFWRLREH